LCGFSNTSADELPAYQLTPVYTMPGVSVHEVTGDASKKVVLYAMIGVNGSQTLETVVIDFEEAEQTLADEDEVEVLQIGVVVDDTTVDGTESYLEMPTAQEPEGPYTPILDAFQSLIGIQ